MASREEPSHHASKGRPMVFVGDVIHVAAVLFPELKVTILYEAKPDRAAASRITAFTSLVGGCQLVAAAYLPFPGIGHIRADGSGAFGWHPAEYHNRAGQD